MADAPAPEGERPGTQVPLDFDNNNFVADKGALTFLGLAGASPDTLTFETLRIFELRKGHTCMSGLPGYYVVNTHGMEEGTATKAHSLPALLHPADEGSPAVFGLRWKIGANGHIYAMTLPTDVKVSTDKDGVDRWLNDKDAVPRRLNLFKSIEPIENRDGQPLAKKFDLWLKEHSTYFKDLKLKNLAATRAWLHHASFLRQFQVVYRNAEAAIRTEVKDSCGVTDAAAKKKSKSSKAVDPATSAEINRRTALLDLAVQPLQLYIQTIAVSVGFRLVELDLGAQDGAEITEEKLEELLKVATPQKAVVLLELLKASDKVKLLQSGTASLTFQGASPFPTPRKPTPVEDAGTAAGTGVAAAINSDRDSDADSDVDDNYAFLLGKRARQPPAVFEIDLEPAPTKRKEKTPATEFKTLAGTTKRGYKKTGIHSKDPIKAANARASARSSDSEAPSISSPSLPYPACLRPLLYLHLPCPYLCTRRESL